MDWKKRLLSTRPNRRKELWNKKEERWVSKEEGEELLRLLAEKQKQARAEIEKIDDPVAKEMLTALNEKGIDDEKEKTSREG